MFRGLQVDRLRALLSNRPYPKRKAEARREGTVTHEARGQQRILLFSQRRDFLLSDRLIIGVSSDYNHLRTTYPSAFDTNLAVSARQPWLFDPPNPLQSLGVRLSSLSISL
jgi:hypothetical protein